MYTLLQPSCNHTANRNVIDTAATGLTHIPLLILRWNTVSFQNTMITEWNAFAATYAYNICDYRLCSAGPYTRGVQKVRRPTQLTTKYAHRILSLFNIDTCNRSHLEPGQRTGCHPKCRLWTTRHPPYLPFVFVLHGKWLAGKPGTTFLVQRYQSFGEMLDQVHFSCRGLCWKVTKYDVRIS